MNAFLFANLRGTSPFPRRRDLDQNTLAGNSNLLVETDEIPCLLDRRFGIERKPRIDFRGYTTRNDFKNLNSKCDQQVVDDFLVKSRPAQRCPAAIVGDGLVKERFVFRKLNGLEYQGRVGCRILRRILPNRLKISRVRDDCRKLLKLIQLTCCGKCSAHFLLGVTKYCPWQAKSNPEIADRRIRAICEVGACNRPAK